MSEINLPLLVEPGQLEPLLSNEQLIIVSVDSEQRYSERHVPTAVHLSYSKLITKSKFAQGMLPELVDINQALSAIGLTPETHVIAYDDEGSGRASRLLLTLDAIGHTRFSLLNGGMTAWAAEGFPLHVEAEFREHSNYKATSISNVVVDKDYILTKLNDKNTILIDARSHDEFTGLQPLAKRSGHIPGAINIDWKLNKDPSRNKRMKSDEKILEMLLDRGITKDKEIIAYCQTCHRSSHSYIMLKQVGYPNIKCYPGSWSEWGNCENTPVIQDEDPFAYEDDDED
jgi:thiosulfate/3-mercaptopyruvate sulfurtransferase